MKILAISVSIAVAVAGAACAVSPTDLEPSGASPGSPDTAPPKSKPHTVLDDRKLDYNEALRTASLKLLRTLPTLDQIQRVAGAKDKRAAYEKELDAMFSDVRFQERMIKWWKDIMRMGGDAHDDKPSRESAPIFAARVTAGDGSFTDLFTASKNTCPGYDATNRAFTDGDCSNNVPKHAGVLTNPGFMYQFYGNMAFRRVRWVQEVFVCTKFPAEHADKPVHMGKSDYTSPWPFDSVPSEPVDFQDTKSVICANCHTTINHIAPLLGHFDAAGNYSDAIAVMTPAAPDAIPTELSHWLTPGQVTSWRRGEPAADLPALGQAIAADPDVAECAVTRAYDFVFSKQDVVTDLATVPPVVLDTWVDHFKKNGMNLKATMRALFASDDFVRF